MITQPCNSMSLEKSSGMTAFTFYEAVAPFKEKQRISTLETEHYQGIVLANEL